MPAQAGIQATWPKMDSRLRGNDFVYWVQASGLPAGGP
jgi:hypothetical protein